MEEELEEVQVTGTPIISPNTTATNSITSITSEEMARLRIVNIADALTMLVPQNIRPTSTCLWMMTSPGLGGAAALVQKKRTAPSSSQSYRPRDRREDLGLSPELPWQRRSGRISNELCPAGTEVGPSGVRGLGLRHGLETPYKRPIRLEQDFRWRHLGKL